MCIKISVPITSFHSIGKSISIQLDGQTFEMSVEIFEKSIEKFLKTLESAKNFDLENWRNGEFE